MNIVPEHAAQHWSRPPMLKSRANNYAIGICLLFFVVLLWTTSNFVTQYVLVDGYQKPFMITYLTTAAFTLYLFPFCLRQLVGNLLPRRRNIDYQSSAQDFPSEQDALIARPPLLEATSNTRLTPGETTKLAMRFCFLWFGSNLTLNASLAYTSVASATILTGTGGILTLLVGRIFHVETLALIKIVAVLTSFAGVVLVSLSDSSASPVPESNVNTHSINFSAVFGDILALLSALSYALYMIFLKVQVKEESRVDMQLLFGYSGLFITLLCWPVALLLHWLGVETLEFPPTRPVIVAILLNMFITLLNDYLYAIAMLKTTPLVVTVGLCLTAPLAVIGDYFLGKPATFQMLAGAVLVTGAFVVIGVENVKPKGEERLLAGDPVCEGMGPTSPE